MDQTRWDYEIIVVVDGIFDATLDEVLDIEITRNNVKVVGYESNRGKGYAVRYGMARAKGDVIAFIDSGMEINANGISMLLEHMIWYNADIVVASKRHPASKVKYPLIRKIYSTGYYFLVFLLFRLKITDTQTGLKVFKRRVLETVLPRLLVKQYAFDIELLAVSKYLGFSRIFEAPVEIVWDGDSGTRFKGLFFMDPFIRNMLLDTLAIFYRMYLKGYYTTKSKRKWVYDKELDLRINTGEMSI